MHGGIIGFGTIAEGHLPAYSHVEGLSIKAVVDCCPDRRNRAEQIQPGVHTYATMEDMLASEALDFIDICSPPHTHYGFITAGLSSNLHVLCEKPFLLSVEDYKGILALVAASDRVVYPSHNYKFAPIIRLLKHKVQSDEFGQVVGGHFRTLRAGHALGVAEWRPHWRREPTISGGGILRDHGTHSIYLACDIFNQMPTSVSCILGNLHWNGYADTEDTALLTLNFGQVPLRIDLSWAASLRSTYYAVTGSRQSITIENECLYHYVGNDQLVKQSMTSEFDDPSHKNWFRDLLLDFSAFIANPDRQVQLIQEALCTSIVIDSAYRSAKQGGQPVEVQVPSPESLCIGTLLRSLGG